MFSSSIKIVLCSIKATLQLDWKTKLLSFETELNFMIVVEHNEANAQAEYLHWEPKKKKGMAEKIEGIFKCGVETSSESTC